MPTSAGKSRPPATSVVAMILTHPSDAMTSGTRLESAAVRRWWPRLTTPPDLSLVGTMHARNTLRRHLSPLPIPQGQARHLLKDCATMKGYTVAPLTNRARPRSLPQRPVTRRTVPRRKTMSFLRLSACS
jgi:hypothetical protein